MWYQNGVELLRIINFVPYIVCLCQNEISENNINLKSMCMKNRLIRFSKKLFGAVGLLMIGALMYSCSDDYDLPDKTPSWLGSSIYDYLKKQKTYTNTIRLIDDLDYATVLSKTGSKTLFVADDDAFAEFFKNNDWGVTCYEDLSEQQKKLLLHTAMLDNPYLLEMLPNLTSSGTGTGGNNLDLNTCMRRPTSLQITDSISFFSFSSPAIPTTLNASDKDYWSRFREQAKGGLYMANDGTVPMMIHWINGQMEEQGITDEDFEIIAGRSREKNDVFIYGSKILEQDITCQNGYVNKLDRVLLAPTNMAEMIRTNGRTSLYSHLLDRFSAPYYSASLTNSLRQIKGYEGVDSVFEKRYLSERSQGAKTLETDPYGKKVSYYLSYDPGWNTYYNASHGVQQDIGAMFAPTDEAMEKYFLPGGGGEFLINAYATKPNTAANLQENLDQIPLDVIQAMINNLMKISFIESVPSKYLSIMNDARDPMFSDVPSVAAYRAKIDTCLIANNGVVYVMNEVRTPAKYASVSAPALVGDSLHIFNWAITADDKYITNPNSAPLNSFISTYLLAMSSNFSFFIPTDNALKCYYDPVSMNYTQPYALSFNYDSKNVSTPVSAYAYKFDPKTYQVDSVRINTSIKSAQINNRLKDMLDQHIIVHDSADVDGILNTKKEYFTTKGGAPVKVKTTNGIVGTKVQGAWQILHNEYATVQEYFDQSAKTNGYGNGMTYIIDKPLQATTNSVYSVLYDNGSETSPYEKFYQLCQVDPDVLEEAGFADEYSSRTDKDKALAKYMIFTSSNPCMDYNVRFFSTYRYTIYVPTNAAIEKEIGKGLPTWESIANYIELAKAEIARNESKPGYDVEEATKAYKAKAQAMCTCLLNFVKYHFQDDAIYNDKQSIAKTEYETACINAVTNRYITVAVQNAGNNKLTVTDKTGKTLSVDPNHTNILTRDLQFDKAGASATSIETSSFAVIHQILPNASGDGVLNFVKLQGDRYESLYNTTAKAKAFMAKYPIR